MIEISFPINVLLPTPPLPVTAITRHFLAALGRPFNQELGISPYEARLSKRERAWRSPRRNWSSSPSSMNSSALARPIVQESDDLGHRRAGAENAGDPHLSQFGNVFLGNDTAD